VIKYWSWERPENKATAGLLLREKLAGSYSYISIITVRGGEMGARG